MHFLLLLVKFLIAPEGSFVVSAAKGRGDIIAKFVFFFLLFFSVFPDFPVSRDLHGKEGVVFICTFNPFMS